MTAFYVSRRPKTNISIKDVPLKKLTVAQLIKNSRHIMESEGTFRTWRHCNQPWGTSHV